jgi:hypothetical protein
LYSPYARNIEPNPAPSYKIISYEIQKTLIAGSEIVPADLGLPLWERVKSWLSAVSGPGEKIPDPSPTWERKHLDIPILPDYSAEPDEGFWKLSPAIILILCIRPLIL